MTTQRTSPQTAVQDACRKLGLPAGDVVPLRSHATNVFLLPTQHIVARVRPLADAQGAIRTATLLRWLHDQQFPAVQPVGDPVQDHESGYVITFWVHYPQPRHQPPASALGTLLRELHHLPTPPIELPEYPPLANLVDALSRSTCLPFDQRAWLSDAIAESRIAYAALDSPLGQGFIHGDAYPGNTLWDGEQVRLGDWDEAAIGPRELDLANTFQGVSRFGRSQQEVGGFIHAYGYDPTGWPGLRVLIRMRDLHTLGAFIRRADRGDSQAAAELNHRLHTLRSDLQMRWGAH